MSEVVASQADFVLVGGGLAGSLLSIYLARRGCSVEVYERRADMRKGQIERGRSINLALSTRGIYALNQVGLDTEVLANAIPMRGRLLHSPSGELAFAPYGKNDAEVINAISRADLNIVLMNAAEKLGNIKFHFNQRCSGIDLESNVLTFRNDDSGATWKLKAKCVIGSDGSASAIRYEMLKLARFNFAQEYLEHGYKELCIPPGPGGKHLLEKNALHIWPRGGYMLIALPNIDGSFTCTLFFPHEGNPSFASLDSTQRVRTFFEEQFPDAVPLMPTLTNDFEHNPTGHLITVKCSPWNVGGRTLLLGDAAHAIVPFYGQGMNCAFEDCVCLDQALDQHGGNLDQAFEAYSRNRKIDTDAIADLAVDNFFEMRDGVTDPKFLLKKKVEHLLEERFPGEFISKYSMVTFHRLPYSVAMKKGRLQDKVLMEICKHIEDPRDLELEAAFAKIQLELSDSR